MATTSSSGRNDHTISGRSLKSQKLSPSGYVLSGCDFAEKKDTSHIGRMLSFDRKPSIRSFHLGYADGPIRADNLTGANRRKNSQLRRSNAVRFGPFQYLRYLYQNFCMRMRMRRRSPVTFQRNASTITRKRSYLLDPATSSYKYRVRKRDIFKRKPSIKYRGISAPMNAMQGAQALEAAERGKNQKFNIRTQQNSLIQSQLATKGLPARLSAPSERMMNPGNSKDAGILFGSNPERASLVLPQPPELANPAMDVDEYSSLESQTEYDDLPDLVPPIIRQSHSNIGVQPLKAEDKALPSTSPLNPAPSLQFAMSPAHLLEQHKHASPQEVPLRSAREKPKQVRMREPIQTRVYDSDTVDIEDALDFVNAWGSYLQQMVASRFVKERNERLKELREEQSEMIAYEESDVSSIESDNGHGVYDSCTSDCFHPTSDWISTEDEMIELESVRGRPLVAGQRPSIIIPITEWTRRAPPPPPPPPPVQVASSGVPLPNPPPQQPQNLPHLRAASQTLDPTQSASDSVPISPPKSALRKVSGPREMRKRHMSLNEQRIVPPLQIPIRRYSSQMLSTDSFANAPKPPIDVRRSLMRLQSSRARPISTEFDFDSDSLANQTNWVRKSTNSSPSSKHTAIHQRKNAVYEHAIDSIQQAHSRDASTDSNSTSGTNPMLQSTWRRSTVSE